MSGLRLVRDGHVDKAIDAMTQDPTKRWTVAELAKVAGLSRAAFARRFSADQGVAPLKWLSQHRVDLARQYLMGTTYSLARIATLVGYACEFAFAKAFKRLTGIAPGVYRRSARVATGVFLAVA
jgi:transcriptional regulator GlxA family with amidase domain